MINRPITVKDLFILSGGLGVLLSIGSIFLFSKFLITFITFVLPSVFSIFHLVFVSEEYTEQTLTNVSKKSFISFSIFTMLILLSIFILFKNIFFIVWIVLSAFFVISLFILLKITIYQVYQTIDFGFRKNLPESILWQSSTVMLYNAETTQNSVLKVFWFLLAHYRFSTLVDKLDSKHPYANEDIAFRYKQATNIHLKDISVPEKKELETIFHDFTSQSCFRCEQEKPINTMYILTEDQVISEAYCSECVSEIMPELNPSSDHESHEQSLEISLDILNLSKEQAKELSREELRKRYRKLASNAHPDAGGSQEQFKLVKKAYEQVRQI